MLSLSRLTGGHHLRKHIAATAAAAASVVSLDWKEEQHNQEDDDDSFSANLPSSHTRSFIPWKNLAQCDAAFLSFPRLRRLPTVQKLHEIAETEDLLETKYKVQWREPLGEGAFGAVFPAVNLKNGEKVAVKEISKKEVDNLAFQQEMDALLLLRESGGHPNICSMRESYEQGDKFYIVLDLINGREIFEHLCCEGAFSEADAARHIREVASALAFLHGIGIIHSDLKPENIMTTSFNSDDAVVKLVDLGCAHLESNAALTDHHQQKHTTSTPAYCPPEVLLEAKHNKNYHATIAPSFDMWSLGVVIYIMLVGVHPFDLDCCASNEEIEAKIIAGEKPPLRGYEFVEHLSEDAIALIEGLMERDPKKRLTAEQVLENRWVQGETATSKKIADSDKRLAAYRKYKTRIGSTFFKTLLSQTDAIHRRKATERVSVMESAFRRLDTGQQGYLSTNAISGDSSDSGEDAMLSFSDVLSLLAENIKNRYFKKDHVVFNEGDCGDSMYLIDSGTVEVTTKDGFKKLRESGEIIGVDVMMSSDKTHSQTVRCVTPVHVLEISRELVEKYVSSDEEAFLSMAETARHRRRERANAILRLNKECQQQSYGKGETIFREGDKGDNLYLVEDGEIDISVHGHNVRTLQQGEMTGEHAAYHGKPYNVTAQCVSKSCKVQALPSSSMHSLFHSDPSLRHDFRDLMLRRDFKKALCAFTRRAFPTTEWEIRSAFDAIDTEQSGEIAFNKLRAVVRRFDPTYKEEDIRDMLNSLDLNRSGSLTWDEFHRIFAMDKEA